MVNLCRLSSSARTPHPPTCRCTINESYPIGAHGSSIGIQVRNCPVSIVEGSVPEIVVRSWIWPTIVRGQGSSQRSSASPTAAADDAVVDLSLRDLYQGTGGIRSLLSKGELWMRARVEWLVRVGFFRWPRVEVAGFAIVQGDGWTNVTLVREKNGHYLQCSVTVQVTKSTVLEHLAVDLGLSVETTSFTADRVVADKAVSVSGFKAHLELAEVYAPLLVLDVAHGSIDVKLADRVDSTADPIGRNPRGVAVSTVGASVSIETSMPTEIVMSKSSARRALLRSDSDFVSVQETETSDRVEASVVPRGDYDARRVTIAFRDVASPLHVLTRQRGSVQDHGLTTWAGREQQSVKLNEESAQRVAEVAEWIQRDRARGWTADLNILGQSVPKGHWRFVSSPALMKRSLWFLLSSLGMLTPDTIAVDVSPATQQLELRTAPVPCRFTCTAPSVESQTQSLRVPTG